MNGNQRGSVALVDGLAALLLLSIMLVGVASFLNDMERMERAAAERIATESLRTRIRGAVACLNISSQNLDADGFEIGTLRFSLEPPTNQTAQLFFMSHDGGIRRYYITTKG